MHTSIKLRAQKRIESAQRRPEQTAGRTNPAAAVLCRIDRVHRRAPKITDHGEFAEPQPKRHLGSNFAAVEVVAAGVTILIQVGGSPVVLGGAADFPREDNRADDREDVDDGEKNGAVRSGHRVGSCIVMFGEPIRFWAFRMRLRVAIQDLTGI